MKQTIQVTVDGRVLDVQKLAKAIETMFQVSDHNEVKGKLYRYVSKQRRQLQFGD
jgi:hypothetical protein